MSQITPHAILSLVGLGAHFDASGVRLSEEEPPTVSTVAWGRADTLMAPGARTPTPGACGPARDGQGRCIPQQIYTSPGLTETWEAVGDGLEQTWTLDHSPPGVGPLVLEVSVDGGRAIPAGGEAVTLTGTTGRIWTVGRMAAWDARGQALPIQIAATAEGLRVTVEDQGARYPITIDPVYTTAAWAEGSHQGYYGAAVAGAGDVNGDGMGDILIGKPNIIGSHTEGGWAFLYLGSADGPSEMASTTLGGNYDLTGFGFYLDAAGDVNGDGYDDVILGAILAYETTSGTAAVYLGSPSGLQADPDTTLWSQDSDSMIGLTVAGGGDLNGDGYDDIVVSSYREDSGQVLFYIGASDGLESVATTTLTGESSKDSFGQSISRAGDVNGDGYEDLIVGAPGYDHHSGRAYLYFGALNGLSTTAAETLTGETNSALGTIVANAGDINADSYGDVLISSYKAGVVTIYDGSADTLDMSGTTLIGDPSEEFGESISGAGDVDGDGYDDIVVGAPGVFDASADLISGIAIVYFGSPTGPVAPIDLSLNEAGDPFGLSVAGAGDVNGDGCDDIVVGSYPGAYVYEGYGAKECSVEQAVDSGYIAGADTASNTDPDGKSNDCSGCTTSGADARKDLLAGLLLLSLLTGRRTSIRSVFHRP